MADPRNMALLLAANPFFGGLGRRRLSIAVLCVPGHLEREEALFLKGDAGDALYAVRRGQVSIPREAPRAAV